MKAIVVHHYGSPDVLKLEDIPIPVPGAGEVLVRVRAAGVGPWDALVRTGDSGIPQKLPLTPGSDICGSIHVRGPGVTAFSDGEDVFGATNPSFTGGYAQYAVARAGTIARKPQSMDDVTAAGIPVVAVTAKQMLFDYAGVEPGQTILVQGGGGSVGSFVVQLAKHAGVKVIATASAHDLEYVALARRGRGDRLQSDSVRACGKERRCGAGHDRRRDAQRFVRGRQKRRRHRLIRRRTVAG